MLFEVVIPQLNANSSVNKRFSNISLQRVSLCWNLSDCDLWLAVPCQPYGAVRKCCYFGTTWRKATWKLHVLGQESSVRVKNEQELHLEFGLLEQNVTFMQKLAVPCCVHVWKPGGRTWLMERKKQRRKWGNWHSVPVVSLLRPSVLHSVDFALGSNVVCTHKKATDREKQRSWWEDKKEERLSFIIVGRRNDKLNFLEKNSVCELFSCRADFIPYMHGWLLSSH